MVLGIGSSIKRRLGSVANKVADKIIPKELAPYLPMLAPAFMGPGAGIMSRYLMPQLLAALSTGKTSGDISGTGQALAGLGSFLSDPGRMALSEQTKPVASTAGNNQNPFIEQQAGYTLEPGIGPSGTGRLNYNQTARMPNPEYIAPTTGMPSQPMYDISQIDNPTFMDYIKTGVNESRDFMQGTNVANTVTGDKITVGDKSKLVGRPKVDIYDPGYQSAVRDRSALAFDLGKDSALQATGVNYRPGNEALVRDAGFMQNLPRRAVMTGINQIGPASTAIDKMKADADAEAALDAEEREAYDSAVGDLSRYYGYLSDPEERFGSYYNNGGRVGLNEGGFFSSLLGDSTVDDIQRGIVSFLGGGSLLEPGMSEYDEAYKEMIEAGIAEEEALDMLGPRPGLTMDKDKEKQANGGRVGLNMGGIMNAGSIPQTPAVPEGMQLDGRGGGFIPMGAQEKQDDVPAMLAKNEFVMTSDAVRAAGGGSIQKGAQRMYDMMNKLEAQA
mgnify:FL=1